MTIPPQASLAVRLAPGKPHLHRRPLGVLGVVLLLQFGCAVRPPVAAHKDYILAARYDLGAKQAARGLAQAPKLDQDLQRLRSLGFNTVVFDYLEDHQRIPLLDVAAQIGLRAYVTDRDLHYYLLTGKLRGASNLDALVEVKLKPLAAHSAFAGVAILSGYPKDRAAAAFAALRTAGIECLVPGQSGYQTDRGVVVAWLDANDLGNPNVSQIERLLLELNGEIYAGWNDGLVIDFAPDSDPQSRHVPQANPDEEIDVGEILAAPNPRSRMFAVESLLRRANLWGARLQGFDRQLIPADGLRRDPALLTTVFVRDARRYLFLFNQSSLPVRGPVRFPAVLGGRAVARAVGVPATADRIAGDVFEAHGGELAVQVNLRPGDAALFEIF